jgi:hypothetical protein
MLYRVIMFGLFKIRKNTEIPVVLFLILNLVVRAKITDP